MKDRLKLDLEQLLHEYELYEKPASDKQRDIVAAAEGLFGQQGFAETPTAEIAKKAKVTEKTLFKHFPSKQDLLRRVLFPLVLKVLLPTQMRQMKSVLNLPHQNFEDAVMAVAMDRLQVVKKLGHGIKLVINEVMQNDHFRERFSQIWVENVWQEIVGVIERFKSQGQIRADVDSAVIGRALIYSIAGYLVTRQVFWKNGTQDDEENLRALIRLLMRGVLV